MTYATNSSISSLESVNELFNIASMRVLWLLLILTFNGHMLATEFGGMALLDYPTNTLNGILHQWREEGDLKWIRANSSWPAENGLNQAAILTFTPSFGTNGHSLPDDLLGLYWHCRTNLPVYPNIIQAWEVWNEPDFYFVEDNPDRMAAVLKAAYWGIKAGNSNAIVLMPSLAFAPDKYPRELARNNIYPYTDGYNFHYYGWAQDFLPTLLQHRRFMKDQGWDLPVWITEAGYFQMPRSVSDDPLELARQQAFHERLVISAYAAAVDYYFSFILTPFVFENHDHSLTYDNLSPRPALTSFLALTRLLPTTRPLFQIWHRPTGSEIGVVLEERAGSWWTILWSPCRLRDLALPQKGAGSVGANAGFASHSGKAVNYDSDRALRTASLPDPTALDLLVRFPANMQFLRVGLQAPTTMNHPSNTFFRVSADHNLHLRTPPVRFAIQDCDWRAFPAPATYSPAHAYLAHRRPSQALNSSISTTLNPSFRKPSPVVLQINYDAAAITPHKPSETYRYFEPQRPVATRVDFYNFSSKPQSGWWWADLPSNWTAVMKTLPKGPGATAQFDRRKAKHEADGGEDTEPGPPLQKVKKSPDKHENDPRTRQFLTVPALDKLSIELDLQPPDSKTRHQTLRIPRFPVIFHWSGNDASSDVTANWLELQPVHGRPNLLLSCADWQATPDFPIQWQIVSSSPKQAQLILREDTPPGRMASVILTLPSSLTLHEDDLLFAEIRLTRTSHKTSAAGRTSALPGDAYYRINLITPGREVFRYSEDIPFGTSWASLTWRIGDFGPALWSHLGEDYRLPVERLRFLRVSVYGLDIGDVVELRNVGVRKFSTPLETSTRGS
jgi:hypothetical protein